VFFRGLRSLYFFLPPAHRGDDLLHHLLIAHEIPLMKVIEVIQEELHVPCLFGQNHAVERRAYKHWVRYRPLLFLFTVPNLSIA